MCICTGTSLFHIPFPLGALKFGTKLPGKRIDDTDTRVGLAVVEVFGIDGVAAELEGGGEDRGIPIGKPVALLDPQGGPEDGFGDGTRPYSAVPSTSEITRSNKLGFRCRVERVGKDFRIRRISLFVRWLRRMARTRIPTVP